MTFIVRLRGAKGVRRLLFTSGDATWKDLQLQIQDTLNVPIQKQVIKRTQRGRPLANDPHPLSTAQPTASLKSLKIKHGDMLQLIVSGTSSSAKSSSSKSSSTVRTYFKLTPKCQHGPRGRCLECLPATKESKESAKKLCSHGPNATCIHCSAYVVNAKKQPMAAWLCNHPDSVLCVKCMPQRGKDAKNALPKCACNKAKGQQCIRCLKPVSKVDVHKKPYRQYMAEKKAMCKYKHAASVTCSMCSPPEMKSYSGDKNCNRGHKPWPYGVCLKCAPPSAHLRVQNYRHCDHISIPSVLIQQFYRNWMSSGGAKNIIQHAALLYGKFLEEPSESKGAGAMRAEVEALYTFRRPFKVGQNGKGFFQRPPQIVRFVAEQLGFRPVGWALTTTARGGKRYKGKIFMSGDEIRQAAQFQHKYKDKENHSQFMTVVIEHNDTIEPKAYQVSDQCVALERDGCLAKADNIGCLATIIPKDGELAPTIVHEDKALKPGEEFLPDFFIVKATLGAGGSGLLAHQELLNIRNNNDAKKILQKRKNENLLRKFSDFDLLCYLAQSNKDVVGRVCDAIRKKKK